MNINKKRHFVKMSFLVMVLPFWGISKRFFFFLGGMGYELLTYLPDNVPYTK